MAQQKNSGRTHARSDTTNDSATKRGPGRRHKLGHQKNTQPKTRGTPSGFVLHAASPAKRERRAAIKAAGSFRQFKRQQYAARDAQAA